jgi:hypothetical protein
MQYLTTRPRLTIHIEGTLAAHYRLYAGINGLSDEDGPVPGTGAPFESATASGVMYAPWGIPNPAYVAWDQATTDQGQPAGNYLGWLVGAGNGFGAADLDQTGSIIFNPYNWEESPTGTWSFDIDVELWVEPYVPANSETIDGTDFRVEEAQVAVPDGLPNTGGRWLYKTYEGSMSVATITLDGATATASGAAPAGVEIDLGRVIGHVASYSVNVASLAEWNMTEFMDASIDVPYVRTLTTMNGTSTATGSGGLLRAEGVAAAPANWSIRNSVTQSADYELAPPLKYSLDGLLREIASGPTDGYPDLMHVRWQYRQEWDGSAWTPVTELLDANPSFSSSVEQHDYAVYANLQGTDQAPFAKVERCPIRVWMDDPSEIGEDYREWRLQVTPYQGRVLTITQSSFRTVSDSKTLTHDDGTLPLTETLREGYRYLRIPYTWSSGDATLVMTLGGKTYELAVTSGAHTLDVDLCLDVANLPEEFRGSHRVPDRRDGRWPLKDGPLGDPDEDTGEAADDGWLWGDLSHADSLSIAVPAGETLALTPLSLRRLTDSEVGVLLGFLNEQRVWTSETDSTYGDYDLSLLSDGKQVGPVCFRFHVVPVSGSPHYAYQTIADVASFIAGVFPGWGTVTYTPSISPEEPVSGAKLLSPASEAGNLDPYLYHSEEWHDQTSLTPPVDLWAGWKLDEVIAVPKLGDPMLNSDFGSVTPLRCSKVMRARAEGLCGHRATPRAAAGIEVELVTWTGEAARGTGVSQADGRYRTGSPWAHGSGNHRTRLVLLKKSYDEHHVANRYPHRTSFLEAGSYGRPSIMQDWDGRLHRLSVDDGDLWYRRSDSSIPKPAWAVEVQVTSFGDVLGGWVSFDPLTSRLEILLERDNAGTHEVWECYSDSDGASWSAPVIFMPGYFPSSETCHDGSRVRVMAEYQTGTDGPMLAKAWFRWSGSTSWAGPKTFVDGAGDPILVADGGMCNVSHARDEQGRLTWSPVLDGDTSPSDLYCTHEDDWSWTVVV